MRLGGVTEVARELGVSRQQVSKLRERSDFPQPLASPSVGDIWDLDAIARWSDSGLRRRRGRPATDSATTVLGRRFRLHRQIGGGGFATVFDATDLKSASSARVAVKTLKAIYALDDEIIARFERELTLLGSLNDPHVMTVLAHGKDSGVGLWYAMPLARGSLSDVIGTLNSAEECVAVMREVCAGLDYIHAEGVLHRDLKPENVLRTADGNWALADFGLARAVAETTVGLTATADAMGSAFYTAPEQWKDAKRVDVRTDIFSAGKILQALVLGSTPVDDDVPAGVLRAVILKAIAHNPKHRYRDVAEFLRALEAAVTSGTTGTQWETPEEKAARLRPRLQGARIADTDAVNELVAWAESADPEDYTEMGELARTMSTLTADSIEWWWKRDPAAFKRVFAAFAERLTGAFDFVECDRLADFTRRAVQVTGDPDVLMNAAHGLCKLGEYHNRWHVRDVAIAILQGIRTDSDATAALEGLRAAGDDAVEWTVGTSAVRTLHPILRAGVATLLEP